MLDHKNSFYKYYIFINGTSYVKKRSFSDNFVYVKNIKDIKQMKFRFFDFVVLMTLSPLSGQAGAATFLNLDNQAHTMIITQDTGNKSVKVEIGKRFTEPCANGCNILLKANPASEMTIKEEDFVEIEDSTFYLGDSSQDEKPETEDTPESGRDGYTEQDTDPDAKNIKPNQ